MKNNLKATLFANQELFDKLCVYKGQAGTLRLMCAEKRYSHLHEKEKARFYKLAKKISLLI